jgi:hypothetical protein
VRLLSSCFAIVSTTGQNESGSTVGDIMVPPYLMPITRCFISTPGPAAARST